MHTYVIGDVHGMLPKLHKLLDRIPFVKQRDTLAFVGDYIDRGPASRGVLDCILDLMDEGTRVICLRGNHELMWQNYVNNRDPFVFLVNGGEATLRSYPRSRDGKPMVPERHLAFLERLLPYYEMEHFILVHAGLRPGLPVGRQSEEDLYWIRRDFVESKFDFGKTVIFGHTPFDRPYIDRFKIGIDTGAVYGNRLSCVRLPDLRFYSA